MPHDYTPQQAAFIARLESLDNSIVLDAVSGSGKTTTLIAAADGIDASLSCLALAFNRDIADVLRERMPRNVRCHTLNSHGLVAFREWLGSGVGTNPKKTINIAGRLAEAAGKKYLSWDINKLAQAAKFAGLIPDTLGLPVTSFVPDTAASWESIAFDNDIERWEDQQVQHLARETLIESNRFAMQGELDFADHLYLPICMNLPIPQYQIVLVDEAQDLNAMQHLLVERSVADGGYLIAVGDPFQAIYGWRGALTDSMQQLQHRFDMDTMPLSVCFRCGSDIVTEAQKYVPHIEAWSGSGPGSVSHLEDPFDASTANASDVVLCRNNAPLIRVAYSCIRARIPVRMKGRDIGASLASLLRQVSTRKDPSRHNVKELRSRVRVWYAKQKAVCIASGGKKFKLQAIEDRYLSVECLLADMSDNDRGDKALAIIQQIFSPKLNGLTLSTIHKAKGLEWDTVYWLDEHLCPSYYVKRAVQSEEAGAADALQQEYNLRYVATTRAKSKLIYATSETEPEEPNE